MRKLMQKLQIKGFIAGMMVMVLLSAVTVFAASRTEAITITFHDIRIVVNGNVVTPKDAQGNVVEPFIWGGTTYLPVRAVADALGLDVTWDGNTYTVYLTHGEPVTTLPAPAPTHTPTPITTLPAPAPTPTPVPITTLPAPAPTQAPQPY